jgi:hypothetical protein
MLEKTWLHDVLQTWSYRSNNRLLIGANHKVINTADENKSHLRRRDSVLLLRTLFTARSPRNGPVCAGIPYRYFFLFLNIIPELINTYYIHLSYFFSFFLTVQPCLSYEKYTSTYTFQFRALSSRIDKAKLTLWQQGPSFQISAVGYDL